jgi:hypothetical protein
MEQSSSKDNLSLPINISNNFKGKKLMKLNIINTSNYLENTKIIQSKIYLRQRKKQLINLLAPKKIKICRKWTSEEDSLLIRLCNSKLKNKWKSIAYIIGNKISSQCSYRYTKLKKDGITEKFNDDILLTDNNIKQLLRKKKTNRIKFIKNNNFLRNESFNQNISINEEKVAENLINNLTKPDIIEAPRIEDNEYDFSKYTSFIRTSSKSEENTKG